MGYIHDVSMSQFVEAYSFFFNAGTWTMTTAAQVLTMDRTAGDGAFWVGIPVPIPSNAVENRGSYLKSIEVMYSITVAACDAFGAIVVYKDTLAATGTLNTAAEIVSTMDTAHDAAAERLAVDEHRMVATLTTPEWIDTDAKFSAQIYVDCAAATVVKFFGALVNYTLRL